MNDLTCQQVRAAALARADGESHDLSEEQIASHLAACAECRREIEAMQSLSELLNAQARREEAADFWPDIAPRIADGGLRGRRLNAAALFLALPIVLLICQFGLVFAPPPAQWLVKLTTLACVAALLTWHRAKPFTIETRLVSSLENIT